MARYHLQATSLTVVASCERLLVFRASLAQVSHQQFNKHGMQVQFVELCPWFWMLQR